MLLPLFFFLIETNDTLADIALRHVSYRISHISDTDDACDMIWLTSIGSQQHEQKRYLYTHYTVDIVGVFDSLWSLNTHKGNGWMATGKMRKTIISNSVGIHQLGNCARVHSHAISIEDIDFFCFFFCFVFRAIAFLMGSFLPLEFSLSSFCSQSLFVSSLWPDFCFDSFSAHGNSFSLILHYSYACVWVSAWAFHIL